MREIEEWLRRTDISPVFILDLMQLYASSVLISGQLRGAFATILAA
jgi:hypothetical protein